jgi:hypothetical protein
MNIIELNDLVIQLNDEFVNGEECLEECNWFELYSEGYNFRITFIGIEIWDSVNDERKYIDEKDDYEPLYDYIKNETNDMIDALTGLKFKCKK